MLEIVFCCLFSTQYDNSGKNFVWSAKKLRISTFKKLKWLIGKNEVLFVVHKFQNSLQTCIKSADRKNNELHN